MSTKNLRRWSLPPAPDGVDRVRGKRSGRVWTARTNDSGKTFWIREGHAWSETWGEMLTEEHEVFEIGETELEAATRRLRERLAIADAITPDPDTELVLRHVLSGGTL